MIANSRVFFDASIVLFLNKTDLFAELCKRYEKDILQVRRHFNHSTEGDFSTATIVYQVGKVAQKHG